MEDWPCPVLMEMATVPRPRSAIIAARSQATKRHSAPTRVMMDRSKTSSLASVTYAERWGTRRLIFGICRPMQTKGLTTTSQTTMNLQAEMRPLWQQVVWKHCLVRMQTLIYRHDESDTYRDGLILVTHPEWLTADANKLGSAVVDCVGTTIDDEASTLRDSFELLKDIDIWIGDSGASRYSTFSPIWICNKQEGDVEDRITVVNGEIVIQMLLVVT